MLIPFISIMSGMLKGTNCVGIDGACMCVETPQHPFKSDWRLGKSPPTPGYVLALILKITSKVYEEFNQEYEWIVHIVLYQLAKF